MVAIEVSTVGGQDQSSEQVLRIDALVSSQGMSWYDCELSRGHGGSPPNESRRYRAPPTLEVRPAMRTLIYNELAIERIPNLSKVRRLLEDGNFRQADVKKVGANLFRVRLNKSDRLLFSLYRYGEETVCLLLEHIRNHAYERSRFLAGATIDEEQIPALDSPEKAAEEAGRLTYLPPGRERFHLLDKVLCLDDDQEAVYALQPPLVLVGSAGSGKTALTLEKMKQAIGDVLYVSLSAYLVRNAREWYYAHGYTNEDQEVTFLSFQELLETIQVPDGREATMRDFQQWFQRHRGKTRLKDPQKVYEEIRGVITGPVGDSPWLSREAYLSLGVKQSILALHGFHYGDACLLGAGTVLAGGVQARTSGSFR